MVPGQAMVEILDVCERVQPTWVRPGDQEKPGMQTKNQRAVAAAPSSSACSQFPMVAIVFINTNGKSTLKGLPWDRITCPWNN